MVPIRNCLPFSTILNFILNDTQDLQISLIERGSDWSVKFYSGNNRLTSGELLSNDWRAVGFVSSESHTERLLRFKALIELLSLLMTELYLFILFLGRKSKRSYKKS